LLHTKIWRRLLVPSDLTLAKLHDVIQVAMGWHDAHLHEFRVGDETYGAPDIESDAMDERKVRLHQVLGRAGAKALYTYDFGDSWEHRIVVEKSLPADPKLNYPVCTGGQRAGPPEDCGGIPGFYELMEAIEDPRHAQP